MSAPPFQTPSRHEKYYLNDEMSVFLVEGKLFKVHRHYLTQESEVFRTMFTSPPPPGGQDGVSDDRPIHLPEVKAREFQRLLDFFYHSTFRSPDDFLAVDICSRGGFVALPTDEEFFEEWVDILSIATRFDFQRVRDHAIDVIGGRIPQMNPIEQIYIADKFHVPKWLSSAFEALCQRDEPLEIGEAELIGLRYATLLAKARERIRKHIPTHTHPGVGWGGGALGVPVSRNTSRLGHYDNALVTSVVNSVFFPE